MLAGSFLKLLALGDDSIRVTQLMRTLTISRSGQIRLSLLDRKRDFPARVLLQASTACRQVFDRVDIDRIRNQVNNLPLSRWLLANRENTIAFRKLVRNEATFIDRIYLPIFELVNEWRRLNKWLDRPTAEPEPIRAYTRIEKLGTLATVLAFAAFTNANAEVGTSSIVPDKQLVAAAEYATQGNLSPNSPINWLDGVPESNGFKKDAITGPYNYAMRARYSFAQTDAEVAKLVASGRLVRLEGPYIRLRDVHSPYVLPIVNRFANRLSTQYAEQGCGKLDFTSATRSVEYQRKLKNGHPKSVHPAGMSLDIERSDNGEVGSDTCLAWLGKTLLFIEGDRRIDVTFEEKPRHFHVVLVPHVYEAWLVSLPTQLDTDVKWLATALYFEASFNESMEGYRAIGWAIRNRVRSKEFPNTIVEVVTEGAAGRSNGGCQFSFTCDGKAEKIQTLCTQPNTIMDRLWLGKCEKRWEAAVEIAEQILAEPESADPTGGAVLYYAASMPKAPYWASTDMKAGTVHQIGSHIFGCSNFRGDKACRT